MEGGEGGSCWCRESDNDEMMTCCDNCDIWYHLNCIEEKMGVDAMNAAADEGGGKWYCKENN